jgi:type I restriction enzyme S subunit
MSEWKQKSLAEITTKVTDGAHHSPSEHKGGLPMFSVKDMRENGFYYCDAKTISEEEFNKLISSGCQPEIDDILIAKDGSVLKHIFRVKEKPDYVLLSSIAIVRPDKNVINPSFLVYAIKEPSTKDLILTNFVGGSGVPRIVLKDFKQIELPIPDKKTQTAISSVLSSLDDKIDLLHRQNATLEKMAETLFRQWFVEEAKEEWETLPLSGIANFLNGLACQKFPPKNEIEKLPVLKIKELSSGITENSDWATSEVKQEYIVKNGDVIFAWSASLMVKLWDGQDCILNQHLFKVTSEDFPKWFYYLWCKYHLAEFISIAASHATTMGHIKRGDLDEAKVFVPSPNEMQEMTEIVEPLIEKIIKNSNQIRTLTALRDTLLPKLMNGEVRVNI